LGYERRFNWAFQATSEQDFIAGVLAGQPDPPTYFATMKRMNKTGPPIVQGFETPPHLNAKELPALLARGHFVIGTRPATDFAAGFLPGTLNLP
jgi:hydroxyacylglutathione hydrolase